MNQEEAAAGLRAVWFTVSEAGPLELRESEQLGDDRIDLNCRWELLPAAATFDRVVLAPLANRCSMVLLRRFFHRAVRLLKPGGRAEIEIRDPDRVRALCDQPPWPGELNELFSRRERYRPLRHYLELSRLFPLECGIPKHTPGSEALLQISFERLEEVDRAGGSQRVIDDEDRYRPDSDYRRFYRHEEPEILDDWLYGWSRLAPSQDDRVLSLGVNDGRELDVLSEVLGGSAQSETEIKPELWGIDHSASAIDAARRRFREHRSRFLHADLAQLPQLDLPRFSIVLALGVLQCTTIDRDQLLTDLSNRLKPAARLLFSIPNCHFGSRDILRRPWRRDDPRHDRSLVAKDLRFLTRWCHRAGFQRVENFGSYDAFVLALRRH